MNKIEEIINEKTTWAIGIPSIVLGVMQLLDADHGQSVAQIISQAGQQFVESGDIPASLGLFGMGMLGIFMKGR